MGVESSPQLFAVMCALYAAGYEENVSAVGFHPVRARLRHELLQSQGPAVETVRQFYRDHRSLDPAVTLSPYVSFALLVGPPPKFEPVVRRDELPPDVLTLEGFSDVLANFYREAQVEKLWRGVQAEYENEIERLQGPVAQIVVVSSGYLREIVRPLSRRSFSVIMEPLVGGKTNFRNFGDHYAIVVSPTPDPPLEEIRHAFLHFLLDPLPLRYRAPVASKKALLGLAARAPRLPAEYKDDFSALFTECLVRAVELRLQKLPAVQLAASVDEAERDGYVLVHSLYRELGNFEQAEPAMSYFFPELVNAVNVAEETHRLEKAEFAPLTTVTPGAEEAPAGETSELERWLVEGEKKIASQDAAGAAASFNRVLEKYPDHPRALYGLAVAAVLQGDGERAKELFRRLVAIPSNPTDAAPAVAGERTDPLLRAWSHVYLGRIYDVEGNRQLALSEYRAALAVESAPEAARLAARRGIEKGYTPAASDRSSGQPRP